MKITNKEYALMNKKASENSKFYINGSFAFLIGGAICTLGQILFFLYTKVGMSEVEAYMISSITLIFMSALLTGLKLYDNIAKLGGAGTLVPITGFSNAIVAPALEFKSEGLILGLGAKMFIIAGPVLVYGITTSVAYGIIIYLFGFFS